MFRFYFTNNSFLVRCDLPSHFVFLSNDFNLFIPMQYCLQCSSFSFNLYFLDNWFPLDMIYCLIICLLSSIVENMLNFRVWCRIFSWISLNCHQRFQHFIFHLFRLLFPLLKRAYLGPVLHHPPQTARRYSKPVIFFFTWPSQEFIW